MPMFNDVEEMAEAAGLLARYPRLRDAPAVTTCPTCNSATVAALNAAAYDLTGHFHGCCIFATFCWTCGLSVATLGLSRARRGAPIGVSVNSLLASEA